MDFNLLEQKLYLILYMALQKNAIGKSIIITLPVYSPVSNQKKIDVLKIRGDLQTKMIAWTFSPLDFYSGRLTNVKIFVESTGFWRMFFCRKVFSRAVRGTFKMYIHKMNQENPHSFPVWPILNEFITSN